jgi:ribosomal protein S18 acetylase RimI-like enzyme
MAQFKLAKTNLDFKTISDLAKSIWTEHYTPIIGIDQINYMLEKFQSENAIENQIKDDNYNYFIIIDETTAIGYLSIKKNEDALFLSKLYIAKSSRGKGLGKLAMNFIEEHAKHLNCKTIDLTVNKDNTNSIIAYQKIGLKKIDELVIDIGNGYVMNDYKMEKHL